MLLKTATISLIIFSFGCSTPVPAQSSGELALTIAGEEQIVPLWGQQSDWSGGESWPSINLYARAFNDDGEDPLVVTLSFEAPGWNPGMAEMRLSRYEDGEVVLRLFAGEDEEDGLLSVALDGHAVDGSLLALTGRVEGTLGTSDTQGREIDLFEGVPVEGTFAVTLEKLD
jgi:hypothetical protein